MVYGRGAFVRMDMSVAGTGFFVNWRLKSGDWFGVPAICRGSKRG